MIYLISGFFVIILIFSALLMFSCCVVAGRADDAEEQMYRDRQGGIIDHEGWTDRQAER